MATKSGPFDANWNDRGVTDGGVSAPVGITRNAEANNAFRQAMRVTRPTPLVAPPAAPPVPSQAPLELESREEEQCLVTALGRCGNWDITEHLGGGAQGECVCHARSTPPCLCGSLDANPSRCPSILPRDYFTRDVIQNATPTSFLVTRILR